MYLCFTMATPLFKNKNGTAMLNIKLGKVGGSAPTMWWHFHVMDEGSGTSMWRKKRCILSRVTASGYIFRLTFRSLSDVLYSDEYRTKKAFSMSK